MSGANKFVEMIDTVVAQEAPVDRAFEKTGLNRKRRVQLQFSVLDSEPS